MRHVLQRPYNDVIDTTQKNTAQHKPKLIRRQFIPKPGKQEKRPLGIPACEDKIIQECVRIIIEPILEAQFFAHSYGFRPMRDTHMAMERVVSLVHNTGYYWIVEGDIKNYFGTINHNKLLGQLWHLGIRDTRVLMIIKEMLEAGVMDEMETNGMGAQQGGVISPLLSNVYLNAFDWKIAKAWEEKKTKHPYQRKAARLEALRKRSHLRPAYLIRYADDWVILTDTRENALWWKHRIKTYLWDELKLELSEEKTKITDIRKKPIEFVGFRYKVVASNKSRTGYVTRIRPIPARLEMKIDEVRDTIHQIGKQSSINNEIRVIHRVNSQIRGIINYYKIATMVNIDLGRYAWAIRSLARKRMRTIGSRDSPANVTRNLQSVHSQYTTRIPAIFKDEHIIGLTSLAFCKWQPGTLKNQAETPYTEEGRRRYYQRTKKRPRLHRPDDLLDKHQKTKGQNGHALLSAYNFEYFLNRGYAFNRDKGRCRICASTLTKDTIDFHHVRPRLPLKHVNRVPNLASVCIECHQMIHNGISVDGKPKRIVIRIQRMREKLR